MTPVFWDRARRWCRVGVPILILLLLLVSLWCTFHKTRLQRWYDAIQIGMTVDDVRKIMGEDALLRGLGIGTKGESITGIASHSDSRFVPESTLIIIFDGNGQVAEKRLSLPSIEDYWDLWLAQLGIRGRPNPSW